MNLVSPHFADQVAFASHIMPMDENLLPSLIGLNREEMGEALSKAGVPSRQVRMRVAQLWHWLYVRGISSFEDMFNISKHYQRISLLLGHRLSQSRFPVMGHANGSCASPRVERDDRWKLRLFIYRKKGVALCAYQVKLAVP